LILLLQARTILLEVSLDELKESISIMMLCVFFINLTPRVGGKQLIA